MIASAFHWRRRRSGSLCPASYRVPSRPANPVGLGQCPGAARDAFLSPMALRFAFVPARWLAEDAPLNAFDRLTLCILCQWVNRERGECYPSVSTIARHAKISESSVRRSIRRLVEVGALEMRAQMDPAGDPGSNIYTILGYDPPDKKTHVSNGGGGTVPQTGGVPPHRQYPPSPQTGGVPRGGQYPIKAVNTSSGTHAVNRAGSADSADASPPRPEKPYDGPRDLYGQPLAPLPDSVGLTQADITAERERLRAALASHEKPARVLPPPPGA
jgi:hypothetical protein